MSKNRSSSSQQSEQSEQKRTQRFTPSSRKITLSKSRTKLLLIHSKQSKQNFLTDPHTSDTAKSSNSPQNIKTSLIQQKLRRALKENSELKEAIINMKANQFYTINQEKVKQSIQQNERLKQLVKQLRKQIQQLKIQNQFLQRNNKHFKQKLEQVTEDNVRKSIDMSKSRNKIDTSRTIVKQENGRDLRQTRQLSNQNGYSKNQYQKKILQNIRSNPNLLTFENKNNRLNVQQKFQFDSIKQKFEQRKFNFIQKQRQRQAKSPKEILRENSYNSNDILKSSRRQILRQYQNNKQKYFTKQENSNRFTLNYNSTDDKEIFSSSPRQFEATTPKNRKTNPLSNNLGRSKSKEISLHAILNQKKYTMNQRRRQQTSNSKNSQGQSQKQPYFGAYRGKQNYNEQYLIGRNKQTQNSNKFTFNNNSHSKNDKYQHLMNFVSQDSKKQSNRLKC